MTRAPSDVGRTHPVSGGEPARLTTIGGFNGITSHKRFEAVFANARNQSTGRWSLAVVQKDGTLRTVWDSSGSYFASFSPTADSLAAVVQTPGGHQESRILSTRTARGRRILREDEYAGAWSTDGKTLLYSFNTGGFQRLGLLDVGAGTTRQLASRPGSDDSAYDAIWTPDDRAVLFVRTQPVQRVHSIDLSSFLSRPK